MKFINLLLILICASLFWVGGSFAGEMEQSEKMMPESAATSDPEGTIAEETTLVGMEVINQQGEIIGRISGQAADVDTGNINYVLIALEGSSEESHAVPFQAVRVLEAEDKVALDIDAALLANAPKKMAGMSDDEFNLKVHEYYGLSPKWERQQ